MHDLSSLIELANQGASDAQFELGEIYSWGLFDVQTDYGEALKWYRLAAEQGRADAQHCLSGMYELGKGVPKDDAEAMKWLLRAAENGDANARHWLGFHCERGLAVPLNYAEALKWYRLAAAQGNELAQKKLDLIDETEALRVSAEQGDADAQKELGLRFQSGRGIPKDGEEAVKWFCRSAKQGNVRAQLELGYLYEYTNGVTKNNVEAHKWFRLAADQGSEDAILWLNHFYSLWCLSAAVRGNFVALSELPDMFTPVDYSPFHHTEATRLAEQGNLGALCTLGWMYEFGRDVPQDFVEAHKWYNLAAASVAFVGQIARDRLAARMTASQVAEAQKLAQDWHKRYR